jgi:hypothetical protein
MCIVKRHLPEVRWLLDFYKDRCHAIFKSSDDSKSVVRNKTGIQVLLNAKVSGQFFKTEKHYFGETALQFAACTNDTDMFDLVLAYVTSEYPNALFSRDSEGNNLIHLLVKRDLTKMYKHVLKIAKEAIRMRIKDSYSKDMSKEYSSPDHLHSFSFLMYDKDHMEEEQQGYAHKITRILFPSVDDADHVEAWVESEVYRKVGELLIQTLNKDGHTPGTLAASLNRDQMLELLCEGEFQWSYGPLSVSRINLDGFEKPINKNHYMKPIKMPAYRYVLRDDDDDDDDLTDLLLR